jgi:8-oxo-dGTP diphosphatase
MREWVVGFLLDDSAERVVLIRKNRPEWQKGKLNGVGGKVEPGELIGEAMVREFREETGNHVPIWDQFARLVWEEGTVHFLRAFATGDKLDACRTVTDENIEVHRIYPGHGQAQWRESATPNLLWLVPLAAHRHDTYDVIDVAETGTTLRKPGRLDVIPGQEPLL